VIQVLGIGSGADEADSDTWKSNDAHVVKVVEDIYIYIYIYLFAFPLPLLP
jgi:hypothetical protein